MNFDYSQLHGRIVTKFGSQYKFAKAIGLSEYSLSLKLNNKVGWKQSEIMRACSLLDIKSQEIVEYFFKLLL